MRGKVAKLIRRTMPAWMPPGHANEPGFTPGGQWIDPYRRRYRALKKSWNRTPRKRRANLREALWAERDRILRMQREIEEREQRP